MTNWKHIACHKLPGYGILRLVWKLRRPLGLLKTINPKKNGLVRGSLNVPTALRIAGLSNEEVAKIVALERLADNKHRVQYQQLLEIANDLGVARQYAELATQNPDILIEEHAWLVRLVRQAISETEDENPWAVLYLTVAYKVVLSRKIEHRLHPRTDTVMPSAFVYAMQ